MGMLDYAGAGMGEFADKFAKIYFTAEQNRREQENAEVMRRLQEETLAEKTLQRQREEAFAADVRARKGAKVDTAIAADMGSNSGAGLMIRPSDRNPNAAVLTPEAIAQFENKDVRAGYASQGMLGMDDLIDLSATHAYKPEETMKLLSVLQTGNTAQDKLSNALMLKMMQNEQFDKLNENNRAIQQGHDDARRDVAAVKGNRGGGNKDYTKTEKSIKENISSNEKLQSYYLKIKNRTPEQDKQLMETTRQIEIARSALVNHRKGGATVFPAGGMMATPPATGAVNYDKNGNRI